MTLGSSQEYRGLGRVLPWLAIGTIAAHVPYIYLSSKNSVPEFIDPVLGVKMIVFMETSPKRSF